METIYITLPGPPIGKGRPRFGRGRVFTPPVTASYERALGIVGKIAMGSREPFGVALCVMAMASMPIPPSWSAKKKAQAAEGEFHHTSTPDVDNILKVILDGLNSIVWLDDRYIAVATVGKKYSNTPMLKIEVHPL